MSSVSEAVQVEQLPIPAVDDPDSAPFWAGCAERKLLVALQDDGTPIHPPALVGTKYGPARWVQAAGTAILHTWTVVEHTVDPAFEAPYSLILVQLTDYPTVRLVGTLDASIPLSAGMPMRVRWEERSGVTLPQWQPDIDSADSTT
ncbi:Zn-ribbon domain-containing OB-fold protein [Rhodococcus sp. ACPA1]|uniref:Zn-ribbon domain-containing OB-fold protein n=1 Tax=Rhodococcus sp. ACPA1 TaxID=2028572 RepID=UPI0015CC467F|nr:OB-fold domain-containing protein [Rhodococcus sp. ACPA1]